jgi:hypothetical protein
MCISIRIIITQSFGVYFLPRPLRLSCTRSRLCFLLLLRETSSYLILQVLLDTFFRFACTAKQVRNHKIQQKCRQASLRRPLWLTQIVQVNERHLVRAVLCPFSQKLEQLNRRCCRGVQIRHVDFLVPFLYFEIFVLENRKTYMHAKCYLLWSGNLGLLLLLVCYPRSFQDTTQSIKRLDRQGV